MPTCMMTFNQMKQYGIKVEPRGLISGWQYLLASVLSLAAAFTVGGILLIGVGVNPIATYAAMLSGALGSFSQWRVGEFYNISETLVKMIPILMNSLAVLVAFRMRFWNIGANGQFAMGAMAASGVALFGREVFPWLPESMIIPSMMICGWLAGAIWGLVAAALKAYMNVNEIISTLMLNYIAVLFVEHLYFGPWQDPQGMGFPGTEVFPEYALLGRIFGRVHYGLVFGLLLAVILWALLDYTYLGYEVKVIGRNLNTARYAGMPLTRNILIIMFLSGGIAGLAGMSEVSGLAHRLQQGVISGYGNTAIIVAWLSNLNIWSTLIISFLMAVLIVGGDQIQITMRLPASVALVFQGLILFSILLVDFFVKYRVRIVRKVE